MVERNVGLSGHFWSDSAHKAGVEKQQVASKAHVQMPPPLRTDAALGDRSQDAAT